MKKLFQSLSLLFVALLIPTGVTQANANSSSSGLDCSSAYASPSSLWPPNHKYKSIQIDGIQGVGKNGDINTTIHCIRQASIITQVE